MTTAPDDTFSRSTQLSIQALIVYSIITMCLHTMPELAPYYGFFRISETIVVAIFTVEYFVRWWRSDNRRAYPFRFMALIDLFAILPFYLETGLDLRGLRMVRLLRLFRILKLGRYSTALQTLGEAGRRVVPELIAVLFVGSLVLLLSAMGLYYAENRAQPDLFSSIPASLWWAVVTLTTVGYGDAYPITPLGKVIAAVVMFMGIGLIAVPTSVISASMSDLMHERRVENQSDGG